MKKFSLTLLFILLLVANLFPQDKFESIIDRKTFNINSDYLTPEILWSFGRINDVSVSPDSKFVLFSVRNFNIEKNKGQTDFFIINLDNNEVKQITSSSDSKYSPKWRPDGKKIGFITNRSGSTQIWEIFPDGSGLEQITDINGGISEFKYSPVLDKILYVKDVKIDKNVNDIYPDLPKANARLYDDLMYRHWDEWEDGFYSHIFITSYNIGKKIVEGYDIMKEERFDTPLKPFGGIEQINWSPDGKFIAYTCKKQTGKQYSLSTNSDIYIFSLETNSTTNLTEGMMGFDIAPVYSPDGKYIAWTSMERDGYESDKTRLFIFDIATKEKKYCTEKFEQNAENISWSSDSKSIYFISGVKATEEIYSYNLANRDIKRITDGIHNYLYVLPAGNLLIAGRQSMSKPTEIYKVNPSDGSAVEISFINKQILDKIKIGEVKKRFVKTTDGKDMLIWVIYPPDFDPLKKYPALLFCEGGPQNTVSQFWSYRWNFQIMAANGYIIVAPNRRGLPSFGMEWLEQISGDYGGQNMKDYLSAIDDVSSEPYINKDKLGAVGASYGGFSVFWLAGNHEKRFKAFIAHDGMFNLESQYLETEEMWFVNWDLGGPFWDFENKIAQRSYSISPHKFVQNWDTPILVIHGEKDYRIAYTQAMQAFNAAVLRGIPAELLLFPEENHWVLSPQNGILWQRTFFKWLDRWLK